MRTPVVKQQGPVIGLRDYQSDAVEAVMRELASVRSTLVVMPTGTGKTVAFADVTRRFRERGQVLVVAHREELINQAVEKIQKITGLRCGIEMAKSRVDTLFQPDVVVASVQTLASGDRIEKFAPDQFSLVVIDEAHHSTASTYLRIIDYFSGAKILGVTATADRSDNVGLGHVYESVAFVYEICDAIEARVLVPIRQSYVEVEGLDLSKLRRTKAGDFSDKDLERIMLEETVLHRIASPLVELAGDRSTIVFVPTVDTAYSVAEVIRRYAGSAGAEAVDGTTSSDRRKSTLGAFESGDLQFLVNVGVVLEGYDAPRTSCVAMARPTLSRALYAQAIGRGTRLCPEIGKTDLRVIDFVGNSQKHKLITTADILAGEPPAELRERTQEILTADPSVPVHEALIQAEADLKRARIKLTVKAKYKTTEIDPFAILGARDKAGRWGGASATDRQREALQKFGVDPAEYDKGQASALLDRLVARSRDGLCTFKQARQLARFGLNPDVTFDDARRALDIIAANRWQAPPALLEDPVFRVEPCS